MSAPDILKRILATKAEEIAVRAARMPLRELSRRIEGAEPIREFAARLFKTIEHQRPAVIAEIKKASPSRGLLRADFDPAAVAASYQRAGATCLSVLTDEKYFQGCAKDLYTARSACSLPVLRKDFIIDPYQVYETRVMGADCVLLIVAALGDPSLRELSALALELGMDVLMEIHDAQELERALGLDASLIGINNRDLRTFETRIETTLDLLPKIDGARLIVAESGIHTHADVALLQSRGVSAFLVGEAFMKAKDPGRKLVELFS
jgi:indole-3-glycerol phosphate synthase